VFTRLCIAVRPRRDKARCAGAFAVLIPEKKSVWKFTEKKIPNGSIFDRKKQLFCKIKQRGDLDMNGIRKLYAYVMRQPVHRCGRGLKIAPDGHPGAECSKGATRRHACAIFAVRTTTVSLLRSF
jgi:hypothetical protein